MRNSVLSELCASQLARHEQAGEVEIRGRLKIVRETLGTDGGRQTFVLKIWRGTSKKPFANYGFSTAEKREARIGEEVAADLAGIAAEETRKAEKATARQAMSDRLPVGTILHYSWGYDQTNCDFFQVVSRSGWKVVIREIAAETVEGSEGFMSDRRKPVRDHFIGEAIVKMIGPHGRSRPTRHPSQLAPPNW